MASFDILNLGGSISPPPSVPSTQLSKPVRPTRAKSASSEEDDEQYEKEKRQKKSGYRRTKRVLKTNILTGDAGASGDPEDDSNEVTRADVYRADNVDEEDPYPNVQFTRLPLGDEDDEADNAPMMNKLHWIEEQLQLRQDEFTTEKYLRIFLGTWNVNAKKRHHEADISAWLLPPDEDTDDVNQTTVVDLIADPPAIDQQEEKERKRTPADIYVVAFQEIVDLNAATLVVDHTAAVPWDQFILSTLHKTGKNYIQIASVHLVGLSMSVFVRDRYQSAISDVRTGSVGTGIMGVAGNKGAVLVRFEIFKSSICIVNSHLAAHQKNFRARNRDYHNILKRALLLPQPSALNRRKKLYTDMSNKIKILPRNEVIEEEEEFVDEEEEEISVNPSAPNTANLNNTVNAAQQPNAANPAGTGTPAAATEKREVITVGGKEINIGGMKKMMYAGFSSLKKGIQSTIQTVNAEIAQMQLPNEDMLKEGYRIYEADHIFWIGDLNYRLDVHSMSEVHEMIDNRRWRKLLTIDQLMIEKKRGHAFVGFEEGRIRFPPTYKYKTGTDEYDKDPKKARYPAYCDRIQWCSNDPNLEQLFYRRAGALKASDHKPVMAVFDCPVKKDIESKKRKLRAHLEMLAENTAECMPMVAVNTQSVEMGDVRFEVPIVRTIIVKNVGHSVCVFRCESAGKRKKAQSEIVDNQLQPWLNVDPVEGVIHPNHCTELTITIFVDRYSAYLLNTDEEHINQSIIIHLTSRHAAEIYMKGRYMKSGLGADIAWLLSLPAPIRAPPNTNDGRQINKDARPAVPYEIYRLVDHIIKAGGCNTKGNFYPPAIVPPEDSSNKHPYETICSTPQVRYICEQLDTGRAFDQPATQHNPAIKLPTHFFVQALLYFLHSLHRPLFFRRGRSSLSSAPSTHPDNNIPPHTIIPIAAPATAGAAAGSGPYASATGFNLTSWCYQALMDLPTEHYRCFVFIIAFLREVLKHTEVHGLDPEALSTCVAGSIMHRMPDEAYSAQVAATPIQIIEHFLTSPEFTK